MEKMAQYEVSCEKEMMSGRSDQPPADSFLARAMRVAQRSMRFLCFVTGMVAYRMLCMASRKKHRTRRAAAEWLQQTAEGCRRILALESQMIGPLPERGLLVANHLSYLDIILFAALRPCVFVSKNEVRGWPVFGQCAQLGGTIFIDRNRRGEVAEVVMQMRAALAEDLLIVLFLEGTSSGGTSVLPFRSSLLEPALQLGCPVTATAISYRLEYGSVPDEICIGAT